MNTVFTEARPFRQHLAAVAVAARGAAQAAPDPPCAPRP
jgi:hypothetical protein